MQGEPLDTEIIPSKVTKSDTRHSHTSNHLRSPLSITNTQESNHTCRSSLGTGWGLGTRLHLPVVLFQYCHVLTAHMYIVHVYTHTPQAHTNIHAQTHTHTCMHACIHTCTHAYTHARMHTHMHACIHTCTYVHTHAHTHTRAHATHIHVVCVHTYVCRQQYYVCVCVPSRLTWVTLELGMDLTGQAD